MTSISMLIEEDCMVLLERALLGKEVCAFGEDGGGEFGTHPYGHFFKIKEVDVCITVDDEDDPSEIVGDVILTLEGYNSGITDHIMTDKNFRISLDAHLKKFDIDPTALQWHEDAEHQGVSTVVMRIDIGVLLDWA